MLIHAQTVRLCDVFGIFSSTCTEMALDLVLRKTYLHGKWNCKFQLTTVSQSISLLQLQQ